MNRHTTLLHGALIVLLGAFFMPAVNAQEGNVAEIWVMHVKDGQSEAFEAAFTKHVAQRNKANDAREWRVYVPVVGEHLGYYVVRYCCANWSDLDDYAAWTMQSKIDEHWNKNVDKHVASYEHYLDLVDFANSNWPEDDADIAMVGITRFNMKGGTTAAVNETKSRMSQIAKEGNWPRSWAWLSRVGGKGGLMLASPYKSWADMAPPEQNFVAFLAEQMGSRDEAQALWGRFGENIDSSSYSVYRRMPHLTPRN